MNEMRVFSGARFFGVCHVILRCRLTDATRQTGKRNWGESEREEKIWK